MSEIKRYDLDADYDGATMMEESDGDYVFYSDHLAAIQQARIDVVREFAEWAEKRDESYREFPITVDAENWINEQLKEQNND